MDSIGTRGVLASSAPHREAMACRLVQAMECGLCEAVAGAGPATGRVGQAATRPGDTFRAPCANKSAKCWAGGFGVCWSLRGRKGDIGVDVSNLVNLPKAQGQQQGQLLLSMLWLGCHSFC